MKTYRITLEQKYIGWQSITFDIDASSETAARHKARQYAEDNDEWYHARRGDEDFQRANILSVEPVIEWRQTVCNHCSLDIEGNAVENDWRDRGNNSTCPHPGDGKQLHSPVKD